MKITPEHYAYLKEQIAPLAGRIPEMREAITAEGKAQDEEKRLRWDLAHIAKLTPWVCANLYSYCNDDHIDTALRRIVREMEPSPTEDNDVESSPLAFKM